MTIGWTRSAAQVPSHQQPRERVATVMYLLPGTYVRLPTQPEWGRGQIQTVTGDRITVNFEHGGKQLIRNAAAVLVVVDLDAEVAEGVVVP